ncbi:MAG TPA: histidinol dehydrogenase [Burkholderiales bacterium]|nr:histidinol dehydrogenase [Burkholderiales bacterium]
MKLRRLSTRDPGFAQVLQALVRYDAAQDSQVQLTVHRILADVRARGDAAVLEYTKKFDRFSEIKVVCPGDVSLTGVAEDQLQALKAAHERIRHFHEKQRQSSWDTTEPDGTRLGQRVTPLDRVGLYVPGGKAAYPSSVLMNAVPAKVAGVRELVMVSPGPSPMVLAAAAIAGVDRLIAIGGAQAVAALAYGTETIPRVDKIVGPGNAYVAEAKRQVFGEVGIDMIAGPSEILALCDGSAPADWVAMDLFSQAEHDESAQAILLSPDEAFVGKVQASIERLIRDMPRKDIIQASFEGRGALILTRDLDEACEIANRIAPEHMELIVRDPESLVPKIRNVGALFVGAWSSEALGDYCAGPNHVLPTAGTARFSSPLGVYDFQKRSSLIEISKAGAAKLGAISSVLADGEGLPAHAAAARMRME